MRGMFIIQSTWSNYLPETIPGIGDESVKKIGKNSTLVNLKFHARRQTRNKKYNK
jgi:hypothetical protein